MPREIHFRRVRCKVVKNPFKKPKWNKTALRVLLGIFFFLLLIFFISKIALGNIGHAISEERDNLIAEIRAVIEIDNAEHLDSDRQFVSDITNDVKKLDNVWSEEIPEGEYVGVEFEKSLDSKSDITIYLRVLSGEPKIEVYEVNGKEIIATFDSLTSNEYNKILLTNLIGKQDVFDLKVVGGSVEIEHIIDPQEVKK